MNELNIAAKVDNLQDVLDFIDAELEANDCSMKAQMQLDIAVEEMYVNIAHYAYTDTDVPEEERTATVSIDFVDRDAGKSVRISLADRGMPYDPLAKEDPDVTLSAEERQIGGLGIYMVKKSMDEVSYEYKDGTNIFTMVKSIV